MGGVEAKRMSARVGNRMGELEGDCMAAYDLGQEFLHALRTDVVLCGCEETGLWRL